VAMAALGIPGENKYSAIAYPRIPATGRLETRE